MAADGLSSGWVEGFNAKTRLIAGRENQKLYVGVEIAMPVGWKTYWRTPGESGVPPTFDWSKSKNLAAAKVYYPAPVRLVDKGGDAIGYHDGVVFPVEITPKDAEKLVKLDLAISYGVCQDICIPVDATVMLEIPAAAVDPLPKGIASALAGIPRGKNVAKPDDPELVTGKIIDSGGKPHTEITARFPKGAVDAFVEGPSGLYVGLPVKSGEADGVVTFIAELAKDTKIEDLKGKSFTVTLVGQAGASETAFEVK